ncbi:amidase family protein [Artemisia annua]|uniref:Amidase family protein n=1 Tax=Artemisia annua TaxID=35608 RepID=A0A2U1L6P6_ARTAN|nr:amidase family protein [Artemisia annua]
MCKTVIDVVYVLDVIVGDKFDEVETKKGSKYIPNDGYFKHLRSGGLKGKRLGLMRTYHDFRFNNDTETLNNFEKHFSILRQNGAILIENIEVANINYIDSLFNDESIAMYVEFKIALDAYLKDLVASPEKIACPQDLFLAAAMTNDIDGSRFLKSAAISASMFQLGMVTRAVWYYFWRFKGFKSNIDRDCLWGCAVVVMSKMGEENNTLTRPVNVNLEELSAHFKRLKGINPGVTQTRKAARVARNPNGESVSFVTYDHVIEPNVNDA